MICSELVRELDGLRVIAGTYWTLPEVAQKFAEILEVQQNVRHAGEAETSMMLALEPELVDQAILSQADGTPEIPYYQSGISRWVSFKEVSANGVIGSPRLQQPLKESCCWKLPPKALQECSKILSYGKTLNSDG